MRALDKDVDRRPQTAREMLNALPEPGPDADGKPGAHPGASASGPPLAAMKTVVLSTPVSSRPAPAAAPPRPASAPPRAPAPRGAKPISTMKTIVLTNPVPAQPPPAPAPLPPATSRRAYDLKEKAISLLERGIKVGLKVITPVTSLEPQPRVSSTAKTAELKLNDYARPAPVPRAPSPAPGTAPGAPARTRGAAPAPTVQPQPRAVPAAKLVARAEGMEFGIAGTRALIGRSKDAADALDVDLAPLKHGAERVSRRHAEIVKRGADYFIRDLGSTNGTFIVGRGKLGRDQLYQLKDRDQVVLGSAILQFRKISAS